MLLRQAGLSAIAGLSCLRLFRYVIRQINYYTKTSVMLVKMSMQGTVMKKSGITLSIDVSLISSVTLIHLTTTREG